MTGESLGTDAKWDNELQMIISVTKKKDKYPDISYLYNYIIFSKLI